MVKIKAFVPLCMLMCGANNQVRVKVVAIVVVLGALKRKRI